MRILNEQWQRLTRAVGNVFLPILAKVLPYLNAILMVLTEIISIIASLFGYKEEDFDYFTGIADSVLDLEEGLDGASESAKKLKQGLRGFDKLNVITTPSSTSSSAGASGGISPDILNAYDSAFSNYMKQLDNVQMKATKIRDTIMEWLGFTKQIDDETGDVSFKFDHITGGTVLGALAVGGAIFVGVKKVYDTFKGIKNLFGKSDKTTEAVTNIFNFGGDVAKESKKITFPNVKEILKGMADLAIIVLGTVAIVEAVGLLTKIPGFKKTATEGIQELKEIFLGLAIISPELLGMGIALNAMGKIGVKTFAKGFADLAIIIGGTTTLITVIGGLLSIGDFQKFLDTGIDSVKKVFQGLWDVAIPLAAFGAAIVALGFVNPATVALGIAGFAIIVAGLEAVLAGLGWIYEHETARRLIDDGGNALIKLGEILGGFAGSIVEAFVGKAFQGLENVGTSLANFMINAQPFFDGLVNVDDNSISAIAKLAGAILIITASDVLDGLTSWFTGGSSMEKFGKDLAAFAPYFVKYANTIKDVSTETVKASSEAALTIAEFAKKLPNSGGLKDLFTGSNDLVLFAIQLPLFGKSLKQYSDNVTGLDTDLVKTSIEAATTISEFASNLPNTGGLKDLFTGSNDLILFAIQLPSFGKNMKKYSENVTGIKTDVVDNSIKSAKSIAEMAKILPNSGGIVSWFTGDNKLSDFGEDMKKFGKYFKEYYDKIKDITVSKINSVTEAIKSLVETFIKVKNNKLSDTVKEFGKNLSGAGENIKSYLTSSFSYDNGYNIGYEFGKGFSQGMINSIRWSTFPSIKLVAPDGGTLQNYKLSTYANGGLPPAGQLFIANEKGAELVGQIGGQSFVANQNQMLGLIKDELATAKGGMTNATIIVQVGDEKIAEHTINKMESMAKANGRPFVIGG